MQNAAKGQGPRAKCPAGEHDHDAAHDCGDTATDAEPGTSAAAADGDASTPALIKPAANDGGDNAAEGVAATTAPVKAQDESSLALDDAAAKAASSKLNWAEGLKRASGWDPRRCPNCGGRRKMIAAIRNPAQVEKILRHVGQWPEAGDRDGDDVIAIRWPPGIFDDEEVDEAPGDKFDGVDDPVELDWAA